MNLTTAARKLGGSVRLGILLILFANLLFALNDAMGKWLIASFALGQVLMMRSVNRHSDTHSGAVAGHFRPRMISHSHDERERLGSPDCSDCSRN
jgi:hypothetical protein